MARTKARTPRKSTAVAKIENSNVERVSNGLQEALFGWSPQTMGTQLNQTDTLYRNCRWYLISNMRNLLNEIYVEHGLIQTLVDVPVDDGLRGGVKIKSKQLEPEDIEKLSTEMEREGDLLIKAQTIKWNRLFGGAGTLIITDQDPMTPLNLDAIKEDSPLSFRAVDMWELYWTKQNTDDYAVSIDDADRLDDVEYYNYYGVQLHKSRVMVNIGKTAPSMVRPRLRGWGLSIVEALVNSINTYLKNNNLTFEVLDEFKLDIFKIKNLANTLMMKGGDAKVRQRIDLANRQKNYLNSLVMDADDEYESKQLSFTGLAEVMNEIRMQIASDMRMPLTKVFGISAAGFNSGEDDIENYNAMVESSVREKAKYDIIKMIEVRCQKIFGFVPDDITIEFRPLRVLSAEQEEKVKDSQFGRVLLAYQNGMMSTEDFKNACNALNLLGIQIDPTEEALMVANPGGDEADETKADSGLGTPASGKSKLEAKQAKA